ncbi:serine/threonine-protein kinase pdik1l-B-like [Camarhynchus parvulus]|uniref:serine/threonine-protein kinase pdik1l-B-like n=1 Tax=Geospiza parvula TaxID=87175 RepID=UPI001237EAB7|nr:serine/threonine-protein kinase pdik1l-B-like [Camarhynchus parvulus]
MHLKGRSCVVEPPRSGCSLWFVTELCEGGTMNEFLLARGSSGHLLLVEMCLKDRSCAVELPPWGCSLWFVTELCEGSTVNELLLARSPDARLNGRFVRQLSSTAAFLHRRRIVHRDLSADSVLVAHGPAGPLVEGCNPTRTWNLEFSTRKSGDFFLDQECSGRFRPFFQEVEKSRSDKSRLDKIWGTRFPWIIPTSSLDILVSLDAPDRTRNVPEGPGMFRKVPPIFPEGGKIPLPHGIPPPPPPPGFSGVSEPLLPSKLPDRAINLRNVAVPAGFPPRF